MRRGRITEQGETMSVIMFNNQEIPLDANVSVKQFLVSKGINPAIVMVRVNGNIVNREQYESFIIPEGACVKAYPFVGGG